MALRVPLGILRCPATGQRLREADGHLASEDGSRSYPVIDGVPVLIDESRSIFTVDEVAGSAGGGSNGGVRRLVRKLPSVTLNVGIERRYEQFVELVRGSTPGEKPRVLVIGGGALGAGTHVLAAAESLDVVESDVYLGPRVSVACDGHRLPFADAAFDGVVIQAVLEHVLDPPQVVAEIHRVLRAGGIVFAETPFMQQVHEGAYDFSRFTELGHRLLFRKFDEIERGVSVGPTTALLWSLRYFAAALPARSRIAARLLDKIVTIALFWLKYLDLVLITNPGAHDAASGVYFLGSRAETPVAVRDVLATYRGTMGSVAQTRGLAR